MTAPNVGGMADQCPEDRAPGIGAKLGIGILVESEAFGERLFEVAGRAYANAAQRWTWELLTELERQTLEGVRQLMAVAGEEGGSSLARRERMARAAGLPAGKALPLLPWRAQMRVVALGTARYLPAFRRLAERGAETPAGPFLDYVVTHELAIRALARAEASGRGADHAPVEALLGRVPAIG